MGLPQGSIQGSAPSKQLVSVCGRKDCLPCAFTDRKSLSVSIFIPILNGGKLGLSPRPKTSLKTPLKILAIHTSQWLVSGLDPVLGTQLVHSEWVLTDLLRSPAKEMSSIHLPPVKWLYFLIIKHTTSEAF